MKQCVWNFTTCTYKLPFEEDIYFVLLKVNLIKIKIKFTSLNKQEHFSTKIF